jgi:hypothetical protein
MACGVCAVPLGTATGLHTFVLGPKPAEIPLALICWVLRYRGKSGDALIVFFLLALRGRAVCGSIGAAVIAPIITTINPAIVTAVVVASIVTAATKIAAINTAVVVAVLGLVDWQCFREICSNWVAHAAAFPADAAAAESATSSRTPNYQGEDFAQGNYRFAVDFHLNHCEQLPATEMPPSCASKLFDAPLLDNERGAARASASRKPRSDLDQVRLFGNGFESSEQRFSLLNLK